MSRQPNLLASFAVAASRAMATRVQAAPVGVKAKAKKQSLI
ncbi:MAG TPA: hypothetical protein VG320_11830 [Paraburkholderia sp.]|jgi:hypothetical protein|nr:hypothetical protein [Paraburkholderia sp.]